MMTAIHMEVIPKADFSAKLIIARPKENIDVVIPKEAFSGNLDTKYRINIHITHIGI